MVPQFVVESFIASDPSLLEAAKKSTDAKVLAARLAGGKVLMDDGLLLDFGWWLACSVCIFTHLVLALHTQLPSDIDLAIGGNMKTPAARALMQRIQKVFNKLGVLLEWTAARPISAGDHMVSKSLRVQ